MRSTQTVTVTVAFEGPIVRVDRALEGAWSLTPGAIGALERLARSHRVVVLTHHSPQAVARWLAGYSLSVTLDGLDVSDVLDRRGTILVTDRWVPGHAHISNRAVRWTTWDAATRAVWRLTGRGVSGQVRRALRYVAGADSAA